MDDMLLSRILNIHAVQQMKACVNSSFKYGAIVGAATIISGILGGTEGLLFGGLASTSLVTLAASKENYKSVPYILIHETTPEERQKLLREIRKYILSHGMSIRDFVYSVNSSEDLENEIIQIVKSLLIGMGLQVYSSQAISF